MKQRRAFLFCLIVLAVIWIGLSATLGANPDYAFVGTFWSLVPPLVAITLALCTKEVYSSLFVGILVGAMLYNRFSVVETVNTMVTDGLITAVQDTAGIFVFLVVLGALVALINQAGGSAAFGAWAKKHIKTRAGAQLATFALGVLIFIDDYFNCLTVGSVMSPVTDGHQVSRPKLAYIIDATAAPICMIAPISSWAAAVSEYTSGVMTPSGEEISSLALFIKAIPYNYYSLLTFVFIIALVVMNFDFGPMKKFEQLAKDKNILSVKENASPANENYNHKGQVIDLFLPIIALIIVSVFALIYVGGFFTAGDTHGDFAGAFAATDATVGLPLGGVVVLVLTIGYLVLRNLISFEDAMSSISKGFVAMVPAILILTLATSLKSMTGLLDSSAFVKGALAQASALHHFLPAIIFVIAALIAFATGTSWGTFGILIPIVLSVFPAGSELMMIGMSACLGGAVCGDHCSPISDTTIMSSAGAACDHVTHVSTQLPYAITVAAVSFGAYLLSGFLQLWYVVLPIASVVLVATLYVLKKMDARLNK